MCIAVIATFIATPSSSGASDLPAALNPAPSETYRFAGTGENRGRRTTTRTSEVALGSGGEAYLRQVSERGVGGVVAENRGTAGDARRSSGEGDSRTPVLNPPRSETCRSVRRAVKFYAKMATCALSVASGNRTRKVDAIGVTSIGGSVASTVRPVARVDLADQITTSGLETKPVIVGSDNAFGASLSASANDAEHRAFIVITVTAIQGTITRAISRFSALIATPRNITRGLRGLARTAADPTSRSTVVDVGPVTATGLFTVVTERQTENVSSSSAQKVYANTDIPLSGGMDSGAVSSVRTSPLPPSERQCQALRRAVVWYRARYSTWLAKRGVRVEQDSQRSKAAQAVREGACPHYLARVLRAKAHTARLAFKRWRVYHYRWDLWLPDKWQRVGACETGYGKRPGQWTWNSGTYQGFSGFYWGTWDQYRHYAAKKAGPYPDDAYEATPRQQYEVALAVWRVHGFGAWGCGSA